MSLIRGKIYFSSNSDMKYITDSTFRFRVTGKTYLIKGDLSCDSCNVIYLITCSKCREKYVGSAINFKQKFRSHKSDIKTNKDRFGTARDFNNKHVLIMNMLISKYKLLKRYLTIICLVLRIYYGNEKNIGRCNYLLTCMG